MIGTTSTKTVYTTPFPIRIPDQETRWVRVSGDEKHARLEIMENFSPLASVSKEDLKVSGIIPAEVTIDTTTGKVTITSEETPSDCLKALEFTYRQVLIDEALVVPEKGKRYQVGHTYVALNRVDAERLSEIDKTGRIIETDADVVHCPDSRRWALWSDGRITTGIGLPKWACKIKSLSKDAEYLFGAYYGSDSVELGVGLNQVLRVSKIISTTVEAVFSHGNSVYAPPRVERMEVAFTDGTKSTWWLSSVGYMEGYTFDLYPSKQEALKNLMPNEPVKTSPPDMGGQLWECCEKCGNEPVYMPLHLCQSCWPK